MSDSIAVKLNGICKSFSNGWGKRSHVITELNLEIMDNEIFGYLGVNGAGKTTTFKLLLDLIRPDAGNIFFWGKPAEDHKYKQLIGYLPDQPYFYSYLTAEEALYFYAGLFDMDRTVKKQRIEKLLNLVGLEYVRDIQLRKFSRGMLQRIDIAQAMVNDPKLLILDEPMSGLDPIGRKEMRDIILSCREAGKTIIFSSHIISDVEMICDRAGILSDGKLVKIVAMDDPITASDTIWEINCLGSPLDLSGIEQNSDITQTVIGNRNIISTPSRKKADQIMERVTLEGLDLISFSANRKSIEDIYIKNVKGKGRNHE